MVDTNSRGTLGVPEPLLLGRDPTAPIEVLKSFDAFAFLRGLSRPSLGAARASGLLADRIECQPAKRRPDPSSGPPPLDLEVIVRRRANWPLFE